jgi:transposase InsO family protein
LKSIFARHGIPECFMSDGGPQYVSFVFKQFAQLYGFQHIVSSPRYAQSNGLAERGVQTIKMMLKKSDDPGFNCFGAIGNKVCNFLPMRSSAGLCPLARGVAR